MGGAPEPPCAWGTCLPPGELPHGIMGQIPVPGTWGRVFQEQQIRVPPGPLIVEHSRLVTHYLIWPPSPSWRQGGAGRGVLNFPNFQDKVDLSRGLPPWADRS